MASPSNYRRNGRKDFCPDCDPADSYRGMVGSYNYKAYCEGWNRAKREYELEEAEKLERHAENWQINNLREKISNLEHTHTDLPEIFNDMLDIIEELKNG